MKTSVKAIIGVVVVGGLVGVVMFSKSRSTAETVTVEAETVEARSLTSVVEASGQIEPKVSVDISSDVIGRILALGVDEGDFVRKDDFLIQIDPTQFEQRVAGLEASLATAKTGLQESQANLLIRKADFDRDKRLYDSKLIPQSKYEATGAAYQVTVAQVASARTRIDQSKANLLEARDNLDRCHIEAPMDGVVIRKNAEVGETAVSGTINNAGSLLLTIADLSVMQTEVDVDETDVVNLTLGQEVEVALDAFPDRKFKGEVTRIANSAIQGSTAPGQRQSVDYKVEVTLLETDDKIRPGLSATARITTARRDDVLSVPIQALVIREVGDDDEVDAAPTRRAAAGGVVLAADDATDGDVDDENSAPDSDETNEEGETDENHTDDKKKEEKEGVFVIRDGRAVFVALETGIAGDKYFEVLGEALQAGDQVVSGNFASLRRLKDGDRVEIEDKDKGDDEDD